MSRLEYTKDTAKRLETVYLRRDMVAQRSVTLRELNLLPDERVLDIGCGPGYLCESMSGIVGPRGAVIGIDLSADLIERCNRRTGSSGLFFSIGDAARLDQADASFDVVTCTQVAEYVPDVDRVLSEAFRVLKPGGRALFIATDWATVLWHSENARRMDLVLQSWRNHCAHPHLPRSLAYRLVQSGFRFDGAAIYPILNLQWDENGYSNGLAWGIRDFVAASNEVPPDELEEWYNEFEHLSAAGQYFFSINRFIFKASKPAEHAT